MAEEKYLLPDGLLEMSGLILKYLQKDISAEEQNTLNEWIERSEKNKQLFDELMNDDSLQNEMKLYYESKEATEGFKDAAFREALNGVQNKSKTRVIVRSLAIAASIT